MVPVYSWIAGINYLLPYSFGAMALTVLKPGYNRGILMASLMIIASLCSLGQGFTSSMAIFVFVRAFSALFHSALNPLIFDAVTDYFPPN